MPLVTLAEEITLVKKALHECRQRIKLRGPRLEVGAMIETPASALAVDSFLKAGDFVSIGTNDLIQYLMAAGREKPEVADYYEKGLPLALRLIGNIARRARHFQKECSVCGQMVNDQDIFEKCCYKKVTAFSVLPRHVPVLKEKITTLSL